MHPIIADAKVTQDNQTAKGRMFYLVSNSGSCIPAF
jgi:hypothetical protein